MGTGGNRSGGKATPQPVTPGFNSPEGGKREEPLRRATEEDPSPGWTEE